MDSVENVRHGSTSSITHAGYTIAHLSGWAVLVTADGKGKILDRRRVDLVDEGLPKIPHHSEGQALPLDQAVELVKRVQASAERHAKLALDGIVSDLPGKIAGIALRRCPQLPPTIAARITDYHARNNADWVMYRQALAAAAGSARPPGSLV